MTKFNSSTPYIACFVILRRGDSIALIKRKNTGWMDNMYALPAGKVEKSESYLHAAVREAREEVGVGIRTEDLKFVHACHRHGHDTDWVDVFFEVAQWEGEPVNNEPKKSEELKWFELSDLPKSTIPVLRFCLEKIQNNERYSEYGW